MARQPRTSQKFIMSNEANIGASLTNERNMFTLYQNDNTQREIWGIKWTLNFYYEGNLVQTWYKDGEPVERDSDDPWIIEWGLHVVPAVMRLPIKWRPAGFNPEACSGPMYKYPEYTILLDREIFKKKKNLPYHFRTWTDISTTLDGIQQGGEVNGTLSVAEVPGLFDGAFGISSLSGTMTTPRVNWSRSGTRADPDTGEGHIWMSKKVKGETSTKRLLKPDEYFVITLNNLNWIGKVIWMVQFFVSPV